MRPIRALLPVLRRQSPILLVREAAWRIWKPYRSARLRAKIRAAEPRLRFRQLPYYQPDLNSVGDAAGIIIEFADRICEGKFPFLGYQTRSLGFPPPWNVDFVTGFQWEQLESERLHPVVRHNGSDVKVPWELSRLQFLPVLAKAYLLTGESGYREAAKAIFSDWKMNNPIGIGVNWTLAMETALRGMSLCFLLNLLRPLRADEETWAAEVTHSIWQHLLFTESAIEFSHLMRSNHYLSNIVGLYCMATFLDVCGMERRRQDYRHRIQKEIFRQVCPDGADYEASFGYHLFTLQLFASSYLLMRADGVEATPQYVARLKAMFMYLSELADGSGRLPHVGDTDDSRVELLTSDLRQMTGLPPKARDSLLVPGYIGLGNALFSLHCGGEGSDAAWYGLHPQSGKACRSRVALFPQGGVAVGRTENAEVVFCAIPNGIKGAGSHTHNDKLSMVAKIHGAELLCDSGTCWYTRDAMRRNLFRSTAAHNTVAIDGAEQNEINPGQEFAFCIADQAKVSAIEVFDSGGEIWFSASHSGYDRIGVSHRRVVRLGAENMVVEDSLSGHGEHSFEIFWHFPAVWHLEDTGRSSFRISGPTLAEIGFEAPLQLSCSKETVDISRTYGGATENGTRIRIAGSGQFPCRIVTHFAWQPRTVDEEGSSLHCDFIAELN